MKETEIKGFVSSIQTLGALDGPGVRFLVFLQGCNLRCGCCHNPETWDMIGGEEYTPLEIAKKAERYREYFGKAGGITVSGGEPLLQAKFVTELFRICKEKGINTCIDTSGSIFNEDIEKLLELTDIVLLDIKYTNDEQYQKYVGCSMDKPLKFLEYANKKNIPVILRQVIIPTLNDNEENIKALSDIAKSYPCVQKTELLPFKKLCVNKYENLKIPFRFAEMEEPTKEKMQELKNLL